MMYLFIYAEISFSTLLYFSPSECAQIYRNTFQTCSESKRFFGTPFTSIALYILMSLFDFVFVLKSVATLQGFLTEISSFDV